MRDAKRKGPPRRQTGKGPRHYGNKTNSYPNTPAKFWKGFAGTQSMGPPLHRKPQKPAHTFWRPPEGKR